MAQTDYRALLPQIDEWIRLGQGNRARRELRKIPHPGSVPRELALPLATAARRSGLHALGLRLLGRFVRPAGRSAVKAEAPEKVEYAANLFYLGLRDEGLALLRGLPEKEFPQVMLFQAFGHMGEWDYAAAVPLLERYVVASGLTPYQRQVGSINLAAAYVTERRDADAKRVLGRLLRETSAADNRLLHGNALELAAQNSIFSGDFDAAERYLSRASRTLAAAGNLDEFFVRKWRAILRLLREGNATELRSLRREARINGQWETLRDCDLFEAIAKRRKGLLLQVYFGTPFPPYRRRIVSLWSVPIPDSYLWNPEASSGAIGISELDALPRQLRRLVRALASDHYHPLSVPRIFSLVFPGEYYDPRSSTLRVHQLLRRLRLAMRAGALPLEISEDRGLYRLRPKTGIRLPRDFRAQADELELLRSAMGTREFSASDAARSMGLSRRSAQRLLRDAREEGRIAATGRGRSVRYRMSSTL